MVNRCRDLGILALLMFLSTQAGSAQQPQAQAPQPPQVVFNPYRPAIVPKPLQYARQPLSPYLYLAGAGGDPAVNYQLFVAPAIQLRNQQLQPQIGVAPFDQKLQQQFQQTTDITPLAQTGRPTAFLFHQGYNDKLLPSYRYVPYNPLINTFNRPGGP